MELAQFHAEDYVEFLEKICPERLEVRTPSPSARRPALYSMHGEDRYAAVLFGAQL